jgi:ComF family protein
MSLFTIKSNEKDWLSLLLDFTSLFFPEFCFGCSSSLVKGEEILCTHCIINLPLTGHHFRDENSVKEKFIGRLPLKYAGAFLKFRKTGIVQHLLHQLKYNNHPEVAVRLGKIFGVELRKIGLNNEFDVIIPMPLHRSRQRKRGYNQSTKFAEGLTASLGIPFLEDVVIRTLKTSSQTRKNKTERWENVKNAFLLKKSSVIRNQRILLVDDIITTGASIEACGQELLNYGCKELSVACIAEAQ